MMKQLHGAPSAEEDVWDASDKAFQQPVSCVHAHI